MSEGVSSIGNVSSGYDYQKEKDNSQISTSNGFEELFLRNLQEQKDEISSTHFTGESKLTRSGVVWDRSNISVKFQDANGEMVQTNMSGANVARMKEKFPEGFKSDSNHLEATGEARDYLATMWEDFYEKQAVGKADKNQDGTLSVDEQMHVRSFVNEETGVYHPADDIFRPNEKLKQEFRDSLKEITIDEAFDHFVGIDQNLDLKISADEALDNGVMLTDYDNLVTLDNNSIESKIGSEFSKENLENLSKKLEDTMMDRLRQSIKNTLLEALYFEKESYSKYKTFSLEEALKIA